MRQIDRFAELLSEHTTSEDARLLGKRPDRGGRAAACAIKLGLSPTTGNGMLQKLRRDLGWQAQ